MSEDEKFMAIAIEEGRQGLEVNGLPVNADFFSVDEIALRTSFWFYLRLISSFVAQQVGAAFVSADGKLLGRGRNLRVQEGNTMKHVRAQLYMATFL